MNFLSVGIALFKRRDFSEALKNFERAGELYGWHVVKANIHLCRKALRNLEKSTVSHSSVSKNSSTLPTLAESRIKATSKTDISSYSESAFLEKDAPEQNRTAFDEQTTNAYKKLCKGIKKTETQRYPTSPKTEGAVDLLLAFPPPSRTQCLHRIEDALNLGRYAIAERWLRALSEEFANDFEVLMLLAQLDYALGNYERVEQILLALLVERNGFHDALQLLSRTYVSQGRLVEAMAVLTKGQGLKAWLMCRPTLGQAKLAAQLDWVSAAFAGGVGNKNFLGIVEMSCSVTGLPGRLAETSYSLYFLEDDLRFPAADVAGYFQALSKETGCMQFSCIEPDTTMNKLECVGPWAFVFTSPVKIDVTLLDAIVGQKRSNEPVVKIMKCQMNESGVPESFDVAGVVASAEALKIFGDLCLEDWLKAAEHSLRVKTVLI